ncbi:MAG TPA: ABC transporter substrate-binding protein [Rubrobacteraceae bacterium]|nr:ABC transporter substrate-binding protein [Rubrobacteraceae bacterium]
MTRPMKGRVGVTRRQFLKAAGMTGMVAMSSGGLLAACGGGQGGGPQTVQGLSVSHWPTLLYSVPWAIAIEQGLFEERDITLEEIVGSSGGGTTVRNVVTGGLPLGAVATPAAINAFNEGSSLKILGGAIANTADISFVTLPDRGIESIEDARGKRVGFTEPGSITQGCAVLSLQGAGIDPGEVELQAMGGLSEALTGLTQGAIDLAPQLLPTAFSTNEEQGFVTVFETSEYVGEFPQLSMIATSQSVQQQPELLQALIEIYQQAIDLILENPQEAAAAWSNNSEVSEEDALASLEAIDPSQYYSTALTAGALNTVVEEMKAIELLEPDDEVDWGNLLDQQFLPENRQVDPAELE